MVIFHCYVTSPEGKTPCFLARGASCACFLANQGKGLNLLLYGSLSQRLQGKLVTNGANREIDVGEATRNCTDDAGMAMYGIVWIQVRSGSETLLG